jgi:hypothetical protein
MPLKIFKPNPRNTGSLCTFNFGPAKKGGDTKGEIALYANILQQATWDAGKKSGSFAENAKNPEKQVRVKFSEFEAGNFMNAIKRRVEFKGYHSHDGRVGHIQFAFSPSKDDKGEFRGFLFSVNRDGKEKFVTPITAGEAENLLCFLDFGLKTLYANRFKAQAAYAQNAAASRPTQPPKTAAKPAEQEENPFDSGDSQPPTEQTEEPSEGPTGEEQPAVEENPFG